MEQKENVNVLLNTTTGEILEELYPGDRIKIIREEQDQYASTHIMNFNKEKTFVKIYDDVVPLLEKYLTLPEFKFAICLSPHVSYEDCVIRETQNRKSRILGLKDLAEIHKYKYDYLRKIMSALMQKGVIGRHETGSILKDYDRKEGIIYTVNPYIYFRGSDIITPIHSFYINSGWKELLTKDKTK